MNIRPILGIDPGITGGIAFLYGDAVEAFDVPVAGGEVDVDTLATLIREENPCAAMVEKSWPRPKDGAIQAFKFGSAYGATRAVVATLLIPQHLISPQAWKKHFRLTADKETSRAAALQLWPGAGCFSRKKDHGRAEAALIARYGAEVLGLKSTEAA